MGAISIAAVDEHSTSSSTIAVEEVTVSHVLTVDGYTKTKRLVTGQFFSSGTFAAGGHRWSIEYFPNGRTADAADYISLFLQLDDDDQAHAALAGVKAQFDFILLDSSGESQARDVERALLRQLQVQVYNTFTCDPVTARGNTKFIKRSALEQSSCLRNDSFRVRCDVTVLKETARYHDASAAAAAAKRFVAVPPPDMGQHLGRLLSTGEGADVTFEVDGETILAHRNILAARSPVFKAELFGPARANAMVYVWVEGVDAKVFRAALHFVYTDALPAEVEEDDGEEGAKAMAEGLLVAAERYGLERLKLICEDKLCDYVDTSSVGTVLAFAEKHACHVLKKACLDFLMTGSNLKAAVVSGGFQHLAKSCPSVLQELLAKVAV